MSEHKRYRRIIDAYRTHLMVVAPTTCNEVDDLMWKLGEGWVCDDREIDLDRLMTAKDIAERFGLEVHNIRAWARRHPDKIAKHKEGNRVLFRVRDILNIVH